MKKLLLGFLGLLMVSSSIYSPVQASTKASSQVIMESSFYGAALGAMAALGIGLIGNNLSTAPWTAGIGVGIFAGMGLGFYEVSSNPSKYSDAYSALTVAELPTSIKQLRLNDRYGI